MFDICERSISEVYEILVINVFFKIIKKKKKQSNNTIQVKSRWLRSSTKTIKNFELI